ncbi:gfo/Idh/MocA family oxidoreductase, partial [Paenibacillus sepulcri]|nr:gfo/Idh/MocA family oxidoreductase [Paenibacillus sepulcri]
GTSFVDYNASSKPYYASLLEHVMEMFKDGSPDVAVVETLEIIRFLEAANESRASGLTVAL